MSRIHWIILIAVLMIPGAAGLGWVHLQKRAAKARTAHAVQAVADAPSADEYLSMYTQWSELTAAQKAENPWGHGKYGGPEIQKRLRQDQNLRFEADLNDLDAGLKSYPVQLADVLYGGGWSERLAEYQRRRELQSLISTASVILLFAGGLLLFGGGVKFTVTHFFFNKNEEADDQEKDTSTVRARHKPEQASATNKKKTRFEDRGGRENSEKADDDSPDESVEPDLKPASNPGYFESVMGQTRRPNPANTMHIAAVSEKSNAPNAVSVLDRVSPAQDKSYFGWAMEPDGEDAVVSSLMTTQPVTNGLSELTEEVSAIRQFAAAQQDQMRKLQDGYDWMIIRRFCMRVIHCIDNLEDRIGKLDSQEQTLQGCLEDIRDELVFALESSGVEQYQPDLKIPFKGLEKYAEAVRGRIPSTDPSLVGMIAEVIRPGYQYLINDDEIKIVRCAQVKLYDTAEIEA